MINQSLAKSCPEGTKKLREKYADKIDKNNILTTNILFSSPSAAARFIGGASLSGNALWKDASGKSLKEIINE